MAKAKLTEEQIVKVLRDPQYTSERQRCFALGLTASGSYSKKFQALRKKHGIPEAVPDKRGRRNGRETEPDILRFEDIRKNDRLMREGKRLIVVDIDAEKITLQRMVGSTFILTKKEFEDTGGYTRVPAGDPQGSPVKTYIDPSLKLSNPPILSSLLEGRKPATINQEFEKAIQEMAAGNQPQRAEETVKPETDYIDPEWGFESVHSSYEAKVMCKARANVLKYKSVSSALMDCIDRGKHLPVELLNEYEELIQVAER